MSFLPTSSLLLGPRASAHPLLPHAVTVACLVLLAWASHATGLDDWLTGQFFDPALAIFPARADEALEHLGHRRAKQVLMAVWMLLLLRAGWLAWRRDPRARATWTAALAMIAAPLAVAVLKDLNATRCPWDLLAWGGRHLPAHDWFVPRAQAGRCLPGGHAAGGFSLLALHFLARHRGRRGHATLALALAVGFALGGVRLVQGAHFLSHNIAALAVAWGVVALVFHTGCGLRPRPLCR